LKKRNGKKKLLEGPTDLIQSTFFEKKIERMLELWEKESATTMGKVFLTFPKAEMYRAGGGGKR